MSLEGVLGCTPLIRRVGGEFSNNRRTKATLNSHEGVKVMELV